MSYTFENIDQWVANLAEKPKASQFHTYARLLRDKERQDAVAIILDRFDKDHRMHGTKEVTILNSDMAIVSFTDREGKTSHIPIVTDHAPTWWFTTFEGAVIGAISLLKTGDIETSRYACKLLDVEI
jgi:hypothetical protein